MGEGLLDLIRGLRKGDGLHDSNPATTKDNQVRLSLNDIPATLDTIGAPDDEIKSKILQRIEQIRENNEMYVKISAENFSPVLANEVGLLTLEAATGNKKIVIEIDPNLKSALHDNPYYLAQYQGLLVLLRNLTPLIRENLNIIENGERSVDDAFALLADSNSSETSLQERVKKHTKERNPNFVVLTGSGAAKSESLRETFVQERDRLKTHLQTPGAIFTNYVEGNQATAWDDAYAETNPDMQSKMFKSLTLTEIDGKLKAGKLVITIHDEASTFFGTSEIAPLVTHALLTGQSMRIMLEPLDRSKFLSTQLNDRMQALSRKVDAGEVTEENLTIELNAIFGFKQGDGITEEIIANSPNTAKVIDALRDGTTIDWGTIAQSAFAKSTLFKEAEEIHAQRETTRYWVQQALANAKKQGITFDIELFDSIDEIENKLEEDSINSANQTDLVEKSPLTEGEQGSFLVGPISEIAATLNNLILSSELRNRGYEIEIVPSEDDKRRSFDEILKDQTLYSIYLKTDRSPLTGLPERGRIGEVAGQSDERVYVNVAVLQAAFAVEESLLEKRKNDELQAKSLLESENTLLQAKVKDLFTDLRTARDKLNELTSINATLRLELGRVIDNRRQALQDNNSRTSLSNSATTYGG